MLTDLSSGFIVISIGVMGIKVDPVGATGNVPANKRPILSL